MPTGCRLLRYALLAGTALTAPQVAADELPTGESVVHGSVGITRPDAGRMAIQQSSSNAIVAWQGFSIGENARVDIHQPSRSSAILNRVTGALPSRLNGRLTANGQVYLVNPNGVTVGKTGSVHAGAFVASTLDIDNEAFLSGRREFVGNGRSAGVANHGVIEIGAGGYAALIGGRIDNSGTVRVPLGRIGLGAGERVTLDFSGDGFLSVALPSKDGGDEPLIRQTGRLSAGGGRIEIKAATARQAARRAINLSGVVEARTVSGRSGMVVLGGGPGGRVDVSGRVDASAPVRSATVEVSPIPPARPAHGGTIEVTGAHVALAGAALDASGRDGGGTILVGGDYQGGGAVPRARSTSVDASSALVVDALAAGDGGRVVVWSDQHTSFEGRISGRGGRDGGDGGFAEVSGARLSYAGSVDLSATDGEFGLFLLDPIDVEISDDPSNEGGSVVNAGALSDDLDSSSVIIDTTSEAGDDGNITVLAEVSWSDLATTLTLDADNDIIVRAPITSSTDGGINLQAENNIDVGADLSAPSGTITLSADGVDGGTISGDGALTAAGGSVELDALGADVAYGGAITADAIEIAATAGEGGDFGNITFSGTADGDTVDLTAHSDVVLDGSITAASSALVSAGTTLTSGSISGTGSITAPDLEFDLWDNEGTFFGDVEFAGGVVIDPDGTFTVTASNVALGSISAPSGTIDITSDGSIEVENVTAPSGTIDLDAAADIGVGGIQADGGEIDMFADGGDITVAGAILAGGGFIDLEAFAGDIDLRGEVTAGSLQLAADSDEGGNFGNIVLGGPVNMATDGDVELDADSILLNDDVTAPAGTVDLDSAEGIGIGGSILAIDGAIEMLADGGGISVDGALLAGSGSIDLAAYGGDIDVAGEVTANALLLDANSDEAGAFGDITLGGPVNMASGGAVTLEADDDILFSGDIAAPGGAVMMTASDFTRGDGAVISGSGDITTDAVSITAVDGGDMVLTGDIATGALSLVANASEGGAVEGNVEVGGIIEIDEDGTLSLVAADNINFLASASAPSGSVELDAGDDIAFDGSILANGGDVSITASNDDPADGAAISGNLVVEAADLDFSSPTGAIALGGSIAVDSGGSVQATGSNTALADISAPSGTVSLAATSGGLTLAGPISVPNGTFTISEVAGGDIFTTAATSVDVGTFDLQAGSWEQLGGPLPTFAASDFLISDSASFLRAASGGGGSGDPYAIVDVYGLQGIALEDTLDQHFVLLNDIAAGVTAGWNEGAGFEPIGQLDEDGGFTLTFDGGFDGGGFAINGLTINRPNAEEGVGLFGAISPNGVVRNVVLDDVDIVGGVATGGVAGGNAGTIEFASVSGTVRGVVSDSFITAVENSATGGVAGVNFGSIDASISDAAVSATSEGLFPFVGGLVGLNGPFELPAVGTILHSIARGEVSAVSNAGAAGGGLVGYNAGVISESFSEADVSVQSPFGIAGGLVGVNFATEDMSAPGAIDRSYALGAVRGIGSAGAEITAAGLAGWNFGTIREAYAAGPVSAAGGIAETGGLVAVDVPDEGVGTSRVGTVEGGFWDIDETGQTTSEGGLGLTTEQFLDTAAFIELASGQGWDFFNDWAPPNSYPVLYATSPVIWARPQDASFRYGQPASVTGSFSGGPSVYVFAPPDDDLDVTFTSDGVGRADVGTYDIRPVTPAISDAGQEYRVVHIPGTLEITPAPLTITANDRTKSFGETIVFDGTEFTVDGLVDGDSVDRADIFSAGARRFAPASDSPYAINIGSAIGDGLSNYLISYLPGELTVEGDPSSDGSFAASSRFTTEVSLSGPDDTLNLGEFDDSAEATLERLEAMAEELEAAVAACRRSYPEIGDFLACLGTALDRYAAELDTIALDLPDELRRVSAIIQRTSRRVAAVRSEAVERLASAQSEQEVEQIGREAAAEASAAIDAATREIRTAITLIRAEEPETQSIQVQQGNTITAALDTVGLELERAVGL